MIAEHLSPASFASSYASRGWHIFPVRARDKIPVTRNGYHGACDDASPWQADSSLNIGIACRPSGLVVIDIDKHGTVDGERTIAELESRLGPLPATYCVGTPRGGRHLYYRDPGGALVGVLGLGVDVKCNGYVVAPPSVRDDGCYSVICDLPVAELPQAWIDALLKRERVAAAAAAAAIATSDGTPYGRAALDAECRAVSSSCEGERNRTLNASAIKIAHLVAGGELTESTARAELSTAAAQCGLPEREASKTINSAFKAGLSSPRTAPERQRRNTLRIVQHDDEQPCAASPEPEWKRSLSVKLTKDGEIAIEKTAANALLILCNADGWAGSLGYNLMTRKPTWRRSPPPFAGLTPPTGELRDEHLAYVEGALRNQYGVGFAHDALRSAIGSAAVQRSYSPVEDYLLSLRWDGVARVGSWLQTYCGVAPCGVGYGGWWLISAVARALEPGCKADVMLVLEGEQGIGKSEAIRALAGEWYQGQLGDISSTRGAESIAGYWIVEVGEMDAIRGRAATNVKNFLSQKTDSYRPAYGHYVQDFPRRCVFAGSTNEYDWSHDESGERRVWPARCGARIDVDGIRRDRDQIWAEAVELYRAKERWWAETEDERAFLAASVAERYKEDPWTAGVVSALAGRPAGATISELLGAIEVPLERQNRAASDRVAAILRRAKAKSENRRQGGARSRVYRLP